MVIQADIWIEEETDDDGDDDDSDCTLSPRLHRKSGESANEKEGRYAPYFTREIEREERSTESIGSLHTSGETYTDPAPSVSACASVCVPGASAKQTPVPAIRGSLENSGQQVENPRCKRGCNSVTSTAKMHQTSRAGGHSAAAGHPESYVIPAVVGLAWELCDLWEGGGGVSVQRAADEYLRGVLFTAGPGVEYE